ncbi:MAG: sulfotransferase, partial [Gammaproteobacteria bacterium]
MEQNGLESMAREYLDLVKRRAGDFQRVTDKMPHNFLYLGVIRLLFPQAKVIHCRRDPIDNCLSIFKHDFTSLHKYAYDLKELGNYYLLYNDLMEHWRSSLPEGYVLDMVYEDMVADQEGMTRRLLDFCDLPWEDGCMEFHTTERAVRTASQAQVRRKIYSDSVKLWQRYEEQLQPMIRVLQDGGVI